MAQEIYPGGSQDQEQDRMPAGQPTPQEQDRMPGASKSDLVGRLKSQKWLVFALMGMIGGVIGALLGNIVPTPADDAKMLERSFITGLWAAVAAIPIGIGLFLGNDIYLRQAFRPKTAQRGILVGLIAGFVAGIVAESLFQFMDPPTVDGVTPRDYFIYTVSWASFGLFLGSSFSWSVPNAKVWLGLLGGVIGGALGGYGFVAFNDFTFVPAAAAIFVAMGVLGFAIGLAIVIVESLFREASLEVVWSPNESSFFNLGAQPIYIGGGREDEIYVRGLGERHSHVVFQDGAIEYVDAESQKRTPLKNESSIQVGPLKLVIHAAA